MRARAIESRAVRHLSSSESVRLTTCGAGKILSTDPKAYGGTVPIEFIPIDRDAPHLFPLSDQDYLPEKHLARFVVDIVDRQPSKPCLRVSL